MKSVAYAVLVGIMSLVALVVYGIDKGRAQTGGRRIPERSLHLLALLGGWPGAWIAQRLFHHKTRKLSFRAAFWLVLALHLALVGTAAYLLTQWGVVPLECGDSSPLFGRLARLPKPRPIPSARAVREPLRLQAVRTVRAVAPDQAAAALRKR